ncbi:MAG: hypothetical protein J5662_08270, partial [Clostridia bacterium]|nr:hypothetical protein [Clostridia bacterium]
SSGKYVVVGDVTVDDFITVSGDVSIILCDGATLRAKKGIGVKSGNSLTIWGGPKGTGKLIATGVVNCAGIGGYQNGSELYDCGTVTINGGIIDATGGNFGAGIGGAYEKSCGTVIVNRGTVTAQGGGDGAGIGGGWRSSGGTVTINGGTVTATGGESGAGIGGGNGGFIAVAISGGTVTAYGSSEAAAIGGGRAAGSGTVTISGGTVNAYGGFEAPAIGGGRGGNGGNITIQGGNVTAQGGDCDTDMGYYKYDIGTKNGSTTTLTYTDDSAATMSLTANRFVGTVKISKVFYKADTLTRFDVTEDADKSALSGTLIPAANYYIVTLTSGYNLAETYDVPVLAGNEYTLPECTFTPPSELQPCVAWVVTIGAGSTELLKPGDTITVTDDTTAYARFATEYGAFQTIINNAANGATITLDRDYISDHPGWDSVFTIPADKEITIDLAGHTIDRGFSSGAAGENCNVFSVYGTLTICDTSANQTGVITGGNNSSAGGAIRVETGGTLNFESGTVSGNKSSNGGGIYNIGTLNISGGLITNNTATNSGGGIFNNTSGTLNLSGGIITNNSADVNFHGGGIHTSGTFNVSGAPVVEENYRGSAINNIGLYDNT